MVKRFILARIGLFILKNLEVFTVKWSQIQLFICKYSENIIWICVKEKPIKIYVDSQTFAPFLFTSALVGSSVKFGYEGVSLAKEMDF